MQHHKPCTGHNSVISTSRLGWDVSAWSTVGKDVLLSLCRLMHSHVFDRGCIISMRDCNASFWGLLAVWVTACPSWKECAGNAPKKDVGQEEKVLDVVHRPHWSTIIISRGCLSVTILNHSWYWHSSDELWHSPLSAVTVCCQITVQTTDSSAPPQVTFDTSVTDWIVALNTKFVAWQMAQYPVFGQIVLLLRCK